MKNKQPEVYKMELTEQQLAEMQRIAMTLGAPPSASYAMSQQIVTLKSLEKFLRQYGIELPVSVDNVGGFSNGQQQSQKGS
jgi:hypothetical protein